MNLAGESLIGSKRMPCVDHIDHGRQCAIPVISDVGTSIAAKRVCFRAIRICSIFSVQKLGIAQQSNGR